MNQSIRTLSLSLLIACGAVSFAAGPKLASTDESFLKEAVMGQQSEIAMGKLAMKNGSDPFIKSFGKMMTTDHGAALMTLQKIAKMKGKGMIPTTLGKEQKATWDKLSKLHGAAFDKAYRADMIEDHKGDLAAFQMASMKVKDKDLNAFAKKCVPVIKKHLKAIETKMMPMGM